MKKINRKILSYLLVLIFAFSALAAIPVSVYAAERPTDPNLWPALKEVYKDYFLIGVGGLTPANFGITVVSGENSTAAMTVKHFNSATPGNGMKPASLWPNGMGTNPNFGGSEADQGARAANARGFKVVGHTLLWHNQSTQWPAAVGGGAPGTPWDYVTAKSNLEYYVKTVAGHYDEGDVKLYAWDVVNEAMKDNPENPADWRNALRTGFNPEERPSRWAHAYSKGGNSWDYMYDIFYFARKYTTAKLIYNDFNDAENEAKATAIAWMVKEFNERYAAEHPEDPRKLVEIVGTQGHYDMRLNLDALERNIKLYLDLGVNVDLTELDIMVNSALDKGSANRIPNGPEMDEIFKDQGIFYAKLFMLFKEYAVGHHPEYKTGVHRVTWWSMVDPGYHINGYLWSRAGNATTPSSPKEAYWAVVDPEGYLKEADMTPGGPATFSYGGKDYKIRTWGGTNNFAELDINVHKRTSKIVFTAANVTLPAGFVLDNIKLDPENGAVSEGKPCNVTVYAHKASNPNNTATYKLTLGKMVVSRYKQTSALESSLAYADVRFSDGVTEFKHYKMYNDKDGTLKPDSIVSTVVPKGERATLIVKKDDDVYSRKKERAWRLAKRIETGRTYLIVSTETDMALTNRTKPATAEAPESLSRSSVTISGDNLLPLGHVEAPDGLAQDNMKFFFQEMKSPLTGQYANQTGYMIECFIHGTNVYPQAVFRGNGATGTVVNGRYSLITRQTNGSEGPQIADKALDRAIWFNTGIDKVTGETLMFMFSVSNDKYYVLKEVDTGITPARDTGNAISQRQTATGGFVAMEADSPLAGTKVKLYVYDAEPYDQPAELSPEDIEFDLFDGTLPNGSKVDDTGYYPFGKVTVVKDEGTLLDEKYFADGWKIIDWTPKSEEGWKVDLVGGKLTVTFNGDWDKVYDGVITVSLSFTSPETSTFPEEGDVWTLVVRFSGKNIKSSGGGCDAGFVFLALTLICPVIITVRRKV